MLNLAGPSVAIPISWGRMASLAIISPKEFNENTPFQEALLLLG